jgi:hypothetical protein
VDLIADADGPRVADFGFPFGAGGDGLSVYTILEYWSIAARKS